MKKLLILLRNILVLNKVIVNGLNQSEPTKGSQPKEVNQRDLEVAIVNKYKKNLLIII